MGFSGSKLKTLHVTCRIDPGTAYAIREIARAIGAKNRSEVIRLSIWYLLILNDPKLTIEKALKPDVLEKLRRGEGSDVPVSEALKPMQELFRELGYS